MKIEWIISSCTLLLLFLFLRLAFRKRIRPCICYFLWLAVAIRLLVPFSCGETSVSILNLLPEERMGVRGWNAELAEGMPGRAKEEKSPARETDIGELDIEELNLGNGFRRRKGIR